MASQILRGFGGTHNSSRLSSKGITRILARICMICALWSSVAQAAPLRLTVAPSGTNQLRVIFGPVVPGVWYEVMARTNGPEGHWLTFAGPFMEPTNRIMTNPCTLGGAGDLAGLTMKTFRNWTFVAGCWDDTQGDELPPLYKDLVLRSDPFSPGDPYGDLAGDGWSNLHKLQNNMDPLSACSPPQPRSSVQFTLNTNSVNIGRAILTIENISGVLPDYILVERAERSMRPLSQNPRYARPVPGGQHLGAMTNRPPFNRPPPYRTPGMKSEDSMITGPFEPVTNIVTRPGVQSYTYVDSKVDTFAQPLYRVKAHFVPPFRASLRDVDPAGVRKTMLPVKVQPATNGYELVVLQPFPHARYLLLVRDRRDPSWRASGYFVSGTNREPLRLHVDAKGMMSSPQAPIAMPGMKFLEDVMQPEFTAGSGEDSDGDGLPDVYEVMVTGTDPANADTWQTGVLDGYKEMAKDGWSNLEKFRRRVHPLKAVSPPAPAVLIQPTMVQTMEAISPRTDLKYEAQVEVRMAGTKKFQRIHQGLWALYQMADPQSPSRVRGNFDVRISWAIPEFQPHVSSSGP